MHFWLRDSDEWSYALFFRSQSIRNMKIRVAHMPHQCAATTRGCTLIIWTGILIHNSNTITDRVKIQARSQNNGSRALKWGIVLLCNSNCIGDMKKEKISIFYISSFFGILCSDFAKIRKLQFSYILSNHQKFLRYREVQYLILKLLTYRFDL